MAHLERRINLSRYKIPEDARQGSVLVLLYEEDDKVKLPLILRPSYDGVHSGQVALPGGKFEEPDKNLADTALREAAEEIGIVAKDVTMVGELTDLYIPPSNFLVHPYVGTIHYKPEFVPDATEVVEMIEISLDDVLNKSLVHEKEIKLSNGMRILTPYFDFHGHTVWGATAMILSELRSVIREMGE